ncbi:glutamate synthase subunit alpha, partial [bacterium]|nr:glutamate synthase subunit alpha [bacterium]
MEPWDGPAAIAFTDGELIGATLDRNGLRPARYTVTTDGLIVLASETGVLDIPPEKILRRGRLQPGKMFLVNLKQHRIVPDNEIKANVSRQQPYRRWVRDNRIELRGLFAPSTIEAEDPEILRRNQQAFGYTEEELNVILNPMASRGQEAIGSMGNDAALPILSNKPQLLFAYFKQLFAQVTNPPIDPLREQLVMSLGSFVGVESNLLEEAPEFCHGLRLNHPILTPEDMIRITRNGHPDLKAVEIDMLYPAGGDGRVLEQALQKMFQQAEDAMKNGASLLILTDKRIDAEHAPIPSLLATSALHHHFNQKGLRTASGVIVETGEAREVMHFALLVAFGADAVCPYLAFSTVRELAVQHLLDEPKTPDLAIDAYITAIRKGLLKTLSRMGISTIHSFFGSQIFEAVGLSRELVDRYFCGTPTRIQGIGLGELVREANLRHQNAFPTQGNPDKLLDVGGNYQVRFGGEKHMWTPEAIYKLQLATRTGDYDVFKLYTREVDEQSRERAT